MFKGVIPAVSTWFKADGTLDYETQAAHTDFLIAGGVHGLFFQGSGGEFPYMTVAERKEHAAEMVRQVKGRVPVIIGVSSNSTDEAADLARHAEKVGADAIVAVTPFYWLVSNDSLVEHYAAIGRACGLPLLAYNFPALTGHQITAGLLMKMKQVIPTLAGIKDTIDSQTHLRSIVVRVKAAYPDFSVMAGIDDYLLGVLSVGGDGLIGGAPNYVPALFVDLYTAYQNKDFDRLMEDQKKVARLAGIAAESMPPVAAYKEATVAVLGRGSTYVRPPLGRVSPEGVGRIKAILAEIA